MLEFTLDAIANYGVLGAWTASLMWEKYKVTHRLTAIIEKNTETLHDVHNTLQMKL